MRLLIIQCAALGQELVERFPELREALPGGLARPLTPPFPAVTCTAQATFRTGLDPAGHGMVANGVYNRELRRAAFWEQSAAQLPAGRIWDGFHAGGGRVGLICWQQSLGEDVELLLSPAPIHTHGGGMIQDCYSRPPELYRELVAETGKKFNLMEYWGPLASFRSTRWIAAATRAVLARGESAPELLLTYLPHLDCALQKHGPADEKQTRRAVLELAGELRSLTAAARAAGYETLVFGDYAITPATRVIFPNRELRAAGLFQTRRIKRMAYPDLYASRAFAMVDHQAAHLYVPDAVDLPAVKALFANRPDEIAEVSDAAEFAAPGTPGHRRAGELVLTAAPGAWFAYPWWTERGEAPDYAGHVDIHNKPGFDPCELFWGWPPLSIGRDPGRIRGTHGRTDAPAAWACSCPLPVPGGDDGRPVTLRELARAVEVLLGGGAAASLRLSRPGSARP